MKIITEKSIQTERKIEGQKKKNTQPVSRWYLLPPVDLASGESSSKPGCVMQPSLTFLSWLDSQVWLSGLRSCLELMRCRTNSRKHVLFKHWALPTPIDAKKKVCASFLHPLPHPMLSLWGANYGYSNWITLILDNRCMHWFWTKYICWT